MRQAEGKTERKAAEKAQSAASKARRMLDGKANCRVWAEVVGPSASGRSHLLFQKENLN